MFSVLIDGQPCSIYTVLLKTHFFVLKTCFARKFHNHFSLLTLPMSHWPFSMSFTGSSLFTYSFNSFSTVFLSMISFWSFMWYPLPAFWDISTWKLHRYLKFNRSKTDLIILSLGMGAGPHSPSMPSLSYSHHQLESSSISLSPYSLHPIGQNVWTNTQDQMVTLDVHETDQSIKCHQQFKEVRHRWNQEWSGTSHMTP